MYLREYRLAKEVLEVIWVVVFGGMDAGIMLPEVRAPAPVGGGKLHLPWAVSQARHVTHEITIATPSTCPRLNRFKNNEHRRITLSKNLEPF